MSDFARVFLRLQDLPKAVTGRWSNRTLSLDAAIMLRKAPPKMFWSNIHDNKTFSPLKAMILGWKIPDSEAVVRSREVLQRYAQATFEPENQQLIRELGWHTDSFIPPIHPAEDVAGDGLAELNDLWSSGRRRAPELQLFFHALRQALDARRS